MKNERKILVEFETPQYGYWDGGLKSKGVFEYDVFGRWGCWELNFWFKGSQYIGWAKRKLQKLVKVPAKITIIE